MAADPGDYRARLYERYVSTRQPASAAGEGPAFSDLYLGRVIRAHFPADRGARILDLGCGSGALVHFARRAGYAHVRGVDISPEQVAEARRRGVEGVEQGDVMETLRSLPDGALDVVVAFDVLEHFRRDEVLAFVDQVRRVLAPGGRWIIHVPNAESPFFGRIRYGDWTHETAFTRTSLHQLLTGSGFARVRCYEDAPVVHGLKSAVRFALWKAVRSALRVYLAAETGYTGDVVLSQNLLAVAERD
jgi:SAM-dependent methyltransferase